MIERPSGPGAAADPDFEEQERRWERASGKGKPRRGAGSGAVDRTISDVPLKTAYGPEDTAHLDLARDLAWPGEYPYTRGIHPNGYRDRLWTMRQFAGFG
ncbi:MAG: methylmalonyl-CoA mutase family protein, partial [Candidatus Tumulicola sp.]